MMTDKHTLLVFYSVSSLTQQFPGKHVTSLGHIIMIPNQPFFPLIPWSCTFCVISEYCHVINKISANKIILGIQQVLVAIKLKLKVNYGVSYDSTDYTKCITWPYWLHKMYHMTVLITQNVSHNRTFKLLLEPHQWCNG
jgi:hypothetical protein